MPIGTPVGFSGTPGAAQNQNVAATLPTITGDGYAVMVIGHNVLTTMPTSPAGWTLLAGPVDNGANNQRAWLFGKTVTAADSGASISATLGASGRWQVAGLYGPGADSVDALLQWTDNTDDLTLDIPAITPIKANTLRAALVYTRSSTGGTVTLTPPSGWTELVDIQTTNASGVRFGGYAAAVQLSGQAGVAQAAATGNYNGASRNIGWELTLSPAATSVVQDLAGTAPAVTDSSATVTGARPLAGSADAVSTSTATVTVARPVAGSADAVTGATGSMTVTHPMSGSADASSGSTATATIARPVSGTAPASTTSAADTTATRPLAGIAPAVSGASVDATVARPLAGTAVAFSGTAADLSTNAGPVNQALAGTATAATATAGTLTATRNTSGTATATSGSSGTLNASRGLTAVTATATATSGGITVTYALTGNTPSATDATGALGSTLQLAGAADAYSWTAAAFAQQVPPWQPSPARTTTVAAAPRLTTPTREARTATPPAAQRHALVPAADRTSTVPRRPNG